MSTATSTSRSDKASLCLSLFSKIPWRMDGGPNFPLVQTADSPLDDQPRVESLLQLDQLSVAIAFTRGEDPKRDFQREFMEAQNGHHICTYKCDGKIPTNDNGNAGANSHRVCPGFLSATKGISMLDLGMEKTMWIITESKPCECEVMAPEISVDPGLSGWHLQHGNAHRFKIEEDDGGKPLPLIEAFRFFNKKGVPVVGFVPFQELQGLGWKPSSQQGQQECITTFASKGAGISVEPSARYALRLPNGKYFGVGIFKRESKYSKKTWVVGPPPSVLSRVARTSLVRWQLSLASPFLDSAAANRHGYAEEDARRILECARKGTGQDADPNKGTKEKVDNWQVYLEETYEILSQQCDGSGTAPISLGDYRNMVDSFKKENNDMKAQLPTVPRGFLRGALKSQQRALKSQYEGLQALGRQLGYAT